MTVLLPAGTIFAEKTRPLSVFLSFRVDILFGQINQVRETCGSFEALAQICANSHLNVLFNLLG